MNYGKTNMKLESGRCGVRSPCAACGGARVMRGSMACAWLVEACVDCVVEVHGGETHGTGVG